MSLTHRVTSPHPSTELPADSPSARSSIESLLAEACGATPVRRRRLQEAAVAQSLGLARALARRYQGRGEPLDDLVQVAYTGLVLAVQRYEPDNGARFSTFATPTILGELRRYFRDQAWTIRPPRRLQEDVPRVRKAAADLEQEHGSTPSAEQIAEHLEMTVEAVREAQQAGARYRLVSLEAATENGTPSAVSLVGDPRTGDIDQLTVGMSVRAMIQTLSDDEQELLRLRFYENLTQQQIADRIGVSQMQVSRLLRKSLDRLRTVADDDLAERRSA
ncbi:sigma-70 family RNA polymerase sigma factor [Blastococcus sp. Marseille-P5729]|uniref:sigma-70 family RNA polymerase sigma factor n=1 Tax=Blastococcus sp. Marseille-P5729 TaxID=2086582 RepID=UPI00131EB704|nr:sigma-70 family RNA polymerase sigma factor [Blastococcus sp. Marseille-P5729]